MFIPPAQILDQPLKRRFRGYSREAVDDLLEEIALSYESVWRERGSLRNMVDKLEKELAALKETEHHLAESLITAERAAAEVRAKAALEAEALLEQARAKSRNAQSAAKAQQTKLRNDIERLERMRKELQENLRAMLYTGLELVGVSEPTKPSPVTELPPQTHKTIDPATA